MSNPAPQHDPLEPPREYYDHLAWRVDIARMAQGNPTIQRLFIQKCKDDSLWFMETFCWLFEPRPRKHKDGTTLPQIIPFIGWQSQIPAIKLLQEHTGYGDIGITKSRAEGASWIVLMEFLRRWLFFPLQQFGLVSRTELAVDNPEDPDTLFWKLDWEIKQLPMWMRPADHDISRNTVKHTLTNLKNGSNIVGYSATGDVARGGRKLAMLFDEIGSQSWRKGGADFAALENVHHVTDSRILVSTPGGPDGAYYDAIHKPSSIIKITLAWWDNETKNRGLYKIINGLPVAVNVAKYGDIPARYKDKVEWAAHRLMLEARGYQLDNPEKLRSEWYDHECLRPNSNAQSIAREVDMDFGGAASRFFDIGLIEREYEKARPALTRGELDFDLLDHKPELVERADGRLRLWFKPNAFGKPPKDRYIIGVDLCMGVAGPKSSSSVATVMRHRDGRIMAEFATPVLRPDDFADYVLSLSMWFPDSEGKPAFIIWEDNGPGNQFRGRLVSELQIVGYDRIYYRRPVKKVSGKKSALPGWWATNDLRRELLGAFQTAIRQSKVLNLNQEILDEMKGYLNTLGGKIIHVEAEGESDPSGAGENHGDRVISAGLCWWAIREEQQGMSPTSKTKTTGKPDASCPAGSFAWRQKNQRRTNTGSDEDRW